MREVWKACPGYEGIYEISSWGNMRRRMNPYREKDGYYRVSLVKDGKSKSVYLHRLICTAFHGPPQLGHQCNHIDGNRGNNKASNLEWLTPMGNSMHRRYFLDHTLRGSRSPQAKKYIVCNPNGDEITVIGLREFCRKNNLRYRAMVGLATGNNRAKSYRGGWLCRYA